MAIGHTFSGDHGPVAVMQNGRQIAGAVKGMVSGTGRAELGSIYKAALPSVTVHGEGKQDKLEGKNLISFLPGNYNLVTRHEIDTIQPGTYWVYLDWNYISGPALDKVRVNFSNADTNYIDQTYDIGIGDFKPYRVRLGSAATKIDFTLLGATRDTLIKVHRIMAVKSESSPGDIPYEPYCGGIPAPNPQYPIEPVFLEGASVVGRGRNLLKFPIGKKTDQFGSSIEVLDDGSIKVEKKNEQAIGLTVKIYVEKGVYTLSNSEYYGIDCYIECGTENMYPINAPQTKNITSGIKNFTVYCGAASGKSFIMHPQFELGSTPTPYTPYIDLGTAPLPILRAFDNYTEKDSIDIASGIINRIVGYHEFTGDEKITTTWGAQWNTFVVIHDAKRSKYDYSDSTGVYSNFYAPTSHSNMYSKISDLCITRQVERTNVLIRDTRFDTEEAFKAYLKEQYASGHPLRVWYALETPIIEHYDPTVLRQHPGYTQLIQQGGFREAEIDCEYWKEMGE